MYFIESEHTMSQSPAIYRLADFAYDLRIHEVPERVKHQAALSILDTVGCALAGASTVDGQMFVAAESSGCGSGDSSVAGMRSSLPSLQAARCNGYLGDIFELNDLTGGHASIGVVPAALALGEELGVSGTQVLAATVAGIEVATRVYNATYPSLKSWDEVALGPVSVPNAIGAASAASTLLGLDRRQTREALSIAVGLAGWSPVEATAGPGSSIKPILPGGWPASAGLLASRYAGAGISGPINILEGPNGYFTTVSTSPDVSALDSDDWALLNPRRKLHASCGCTHSAVDVAMSLHERDPRILTDARSVQISMPEYVIPLVVKKDPPASPTDARFHTQYVFAVAGSGRGAIAPDHSENVKRHLAQPDIQSLYERIKIVTDSSLDHYHQTIVRVEMPDGTILQEGHSSPKGSPGNPMSDQEVIDKFLALAMPTMGRDNATALWHRIESIDTAESLTEISQLLQSPQENAVA